jgi:hypothetical protein
MADDHDRRVTPTTGDLLYRHILGPSPEFDWCRLRAIAGPARWRRMCELALMVSRYAGQYGLPLANEGEFALLWWLANFGNPQQATARFAAVANLCEVANDLPDYRGYHPELGRCLDENEPWRAGSWVVEALDWLCCDVFAAEQASRAGEPATEATDHPGPAVAQLSSPIPTPPPPATPALTRSKKKGIELPRVLARMRTDGLATVESMPRKDRSGAYNTSDRTADRALQQLREEHSAKVAASIK